MGSLLVDGKKLRPPRILDRAPKSWNYDRNWPLCQFTGWFLNKKVRIPLIKGLGRLDWPKTPLKNSFQGISRFLDYWPKFSPLSHGIPIGPLKALYGVGGMGAALFYQSCERRGRNAIEAGQVAHASWQQLV